MDIARAGVRENATYPELRRRVLTAAVLAINVALALVPAAIGALVLFGLVR